jgi:serine/threonine protein kinase
MKEVDRLLQIENLIRPVADRLEHIRVPHPYFHHKKTVQCYGMEYVDGYTLFDIIEDTNMSEEEKAQLKNTFGEIDIDKLFSEIELFFERIHEYCHHGDIKPKNIMLSKTGKIYFIDFGQAYLTSHIPDKARDQQDTLAASEIEICKRFVQRALTKLS